VIGFCIDSNAQLPAELAQRYGVEIVPLTVTIDGHEFVEGVDLDADEFYARFATAEADGRPAPVVTTAAPSPGRFVVAYEALAQRGATEILSVHLGSAFSGTVNAARLAAGMGDVPVRIVDTGTASFAIACCLWEAAEAVADGMSLEEAANVAESVSTRCDTVFVVKALDLARAGGRLAGQDTDADPGLIPVLRLVGGAMTTVARVRTVDDVAEAMAAQVRAGGENLRVGVGVADAGAAPIWRALESRLRVAPEIFDVVRYRVGPSVGVHTGPGTAGACWYPTTITARR
jgi:DegV family protein with EDD domain